MGDWQSNLEGFDTLQKRPKSSCYVQLKVCCSGTTFVFFLSRSLTPDATKTYHYRARVLPERYHVSIQKARVCVLS